MGHSKLTQEEIETLKKRINAELDAITPDQIPHIIFCCAEGDHDETRVIMVGCAGWQMETAQGIQTSVLKASFDHLADLNNEEDEESTS